MTRFRIYERPPGKGYSFQADVKDGKHVYVVRQRKKSGVYVCSCRQTKGGNCIHVKDVLDMRLNMGESRTFVRLDKNGDELMEY